MPSKPQIHPPHLLILSPGFPGDEQDFLCIPPLQAFLPALQKQFPSWKITVVTFHYPYQKARYTWQNIEVHALGGNNRSGLSKLRLWLKATRRIKKLHKARPFTMVHSLWLQECTFLAQRFAKKRGLPHVATLQGQDAKANNPYLDRLDWERIKVVAISKRAGDELQKNCKSSLNIEVLPWGFEPDRQADCLAREQREIDILGVGSLIQLKNYRLFLQVVAEVKKEKPDLKAMLIGEGPEMSALQSQAEKLGLAEIIEFSGLLPRPEVLAAMARSRVFLHTSDSEGQGYVFNEALASGMHLVSTPVGIATAMPEWRIAPDLAGLSAQVSDLLTGALAHERKCLHSMRETVEGYARLYQK